MAAALRYPLKRIDESDDYLSIQILEYIAPGFGGIDEKLQVETSSALQYQNKQVLQTILLPMPQGLSDQSSVGWGDDSLNTAEAFGAAKISGVLGSEDALKGGYDAIKSSVTALTNASKTGAAQKAVQSYFSSNLVNSLGGNTSASGLLSRATGQVLNPHMELLFKSVSLRSFTFSFDFAPRDADEALQVKQIIRSFKQQMSPKNQAQNGSPNGGAGGIFITSPSVFFLEYRTGSKKHPFLNSFKPMALTNMSVNYAASGAYATYEDATPVHLQMTIGFQELNPIYNEDYDDISLDNGVGY
jgi:hypothetical protein